MTVNTWRTLLLIYDRLAVTCNGPGGRPTAFAHTLSDEELREGCESFRQFPALVDDLTAGAVEIECEVARAAHPLATLTRLRESQFWPSPDDTRGELRRLTTLRGFHSIFVYWPQNDLQTGASVPSGGWGLGMGASAWSWNATYATVANAPAWAWRIPLMGEIWLHEWLHGVCAHFARQGHLMPAGDADGGDRHGYTRSPETGWTGYYRDLMSANVLEDSQPKGIPLAAWRAPLPRL